MLKLLQIGGLMSKQVVSLLPGDQVDLISVADDDNYVTYYGS